MRVLAALALAGAANAQQTFTSACEANIVDSGDAGVNVEDLLALLSVYGQSCYEDASKGGCAAGSICNLKGGDTSSAGVGGWMPINVDQSKGAIKGQPSHYTTYSVAPLAGASWSGKAGITMDGDLNDWGYVDFLAQTYFYPYNEKGNNGGPKGKTNSMLVFDEYNGGVWNGIYDQASAFALTWEPTGLYFGMKVIDDAHQLSGTNGWNGDSLQIAFGNSKRTSITHLVNYAIDDGPKMGNAVHHHERGPAINGGTRTTAVITRFDCPTGASKCRRLGGGGACAGAAAKAAKVKGCVGMTTYEIKIPAKYFGKNALSPGWSSGFGQCINDGDPGKVNGKSQQGQRGWTGWGPYSIVYGKNAPEAGVISLVDFQDNSAYDTMSKATGDTSTSGVGAWKLQAGPKFSQDGADCKGAGLGKQTHDPPSKGGKALGLYPRRITVDGDLAEWGGIPILADSVFYPFNKRAGSGIHDIYSKCGGKAKVPLVIFDRHGGGTWKGRADQSMAFSMAWEPNALYMGIKVFDDTHQLTGINGWHGDSLQIAVSDNKLKKVTHLWNYAMADGTIKGSKFGDNIHHHQQGQKKGAEASEAVITRYTKAKPYVTTYEIKMPAASFAAGGTLKKGQTLGFGQCVNDGDTDKGQGGQKGWTGWGPYSIVYGKNAPESGIIRMDDMNDAAGDLQMTYTTGRDNSKSGLGLWLPDPVASMTLDANGKLVTMSSKKGKGTIMIKPDDPMISHNTPYSVTAKSIGMDGDLADWAGVQYLAQSWFLPYNKNNGRGAFGGKHGSPILTTFDEYNGGIWNGIMDCSSAFALSWDPFYLNMGIKVLDDTHDLVGASGWNGDSLQVAFTNVAQTKITKLYNFALRNDAKNMVHHHERGHGGVEKAEAVITRYSSNCIGVVCAGTNWVKCNTAKAGDKGDGSAASCSGAANSPITTYEIRFPAAAWKLKQFSAGWSMGFGQCMNDGDTDQKSYPRKGAKKGSPESKKAGNQRGQRGWTGWGPYTIVYGKNAGDGGIINLVKYDFQDASAGLGTNTACGAGGCDSSTTGLGAWVPKTNNGGKGASGSLKCGGTPTHEKGTMNIAKGTMKVDGNLADWGSIQFAADSYNYPYNKAKNSGGHKGRVQSWMSAAQGKCSKSAKQMVIFDEYNGGIWTGAVDQSMAFALAWDASSLYMGIKVIDDSHQMSGNSGWNGDTVQVAFTDAARSKITHLYNYGMNEAAAAKVIHHHERGHKGPSATDCVVTRYDPCVSQGKFGCQGNDKMMVTSYEISFPASSWGVAAFRTGMVSGFSQCVNDGDKTCSGAKKCNLGKQKGQRGWTGWGPYAIVYGKNAPEAGTIKLV